MNRRKFLKHSVALVAAAAVPFPLPTLAAATVPTTLFRGELGMWNNVKIICTPEASKVFGRALFAAANGTSLAMVGSLGARRKRKKRKKQ